MINYQFVGNSDPKLELVTKEKLQGAKFFEEELFSLFCLIWIFLSIYWCNLLNHIYTYILFDILYFTIISFRYIFLLLGMSSTSGWLVSKKSIESQKVSFVGQLASLLHAVLLSSRVNRHPCVFIKIIYISMSFLYHIFIILVIFKIWYCTLF